MDLEAVRTLPIADQMTFLRGRILEASLSMEAVARYLHVRLGGGSDLEAALDTPQPFKALITACGEMASITQQLTNGTRPLVMDAIHKADALYGQRNRFVHDLLRSSLTSEDKWERAKLSRPKREIGSPPPQPEAATADEMVALIFDLIGTTWRLRGALWSLISPSGEVSPFLTHRLDAQWDGSTLSLSPTASQSDAES